MELHKYVRQSNEVEMDMTPMIDIVFLLIIFFMVVTELSNLDIVELILPEATQAVQEPPTPGARKVTVNVRLKEKISADLGAGEIVVGGDVQTVKELAILLENEAIKYGRYTKNPADPTKEDSELDVLLRVDQGVNAGFIHLVYRACQKAKVYKVKLAALNKHIENPYQPSN